MNRRSEGGFTLVELVFGVVIMTMMVASIGQLYISNLNTVVLGKSRAIGVALVNEKMEALRDLPYDSVATKNGTIYPPGNILDDEIVVKDNYKFNVHTDINFIDDPYDGYISCPCGSGPASGKPKDLYPYDYKKSQITVKLVSSGAVVAGVTTDIAGKAAETSSNTGILSIKVIDSNGNPIPNATVTVVNTNPTPDVNISTTTDNDGVVMIPKLPPDSSNRYQVIASLPGYSTDGTIPDPAGANTTAVQLNPNVLVQQITPVTLKIDRLSTLYVHVTDTAGAPINNLSVMTLSAKKLEVTTPYPPNAPKYKYSVATATNTTGDITLSGMEWDSYSFAVPSGYYVVTSSPYATFGSIGSSTYGALPAAATALAANSSTTVNLVVSTNSAYPTIVKAAPVAAQTGTSSLSLKATGTNLSSGSTMKLKKAGQTDITATGCVSGSSNTTLTCTVNLTGAVTGAWDVAITRSGNTATQVGGFDVTP